jgi:hypothetical protein
MGEGERERGKWGGGILRVYGARGHLSGHSSKPWLLIFWSKIKTSTDIKMKSRLHLEETNIKKYFYLFMYTDMT